LNINALKLKEPLLVCSQPCQIFEYKVKGPKFHTITSIPSKPLTLCTGNKEGENHSVLGFPHPDKPEEYLVVDMTRVQYGIAGRGIYGETYFLGTLDTYVSSMGKFCEGLIDVGHGASYMEMESGETKARLIRCAKRVWERWQNREKEGWCEYCGKGGPNLMKCGGCKKVAIWYCCKEHQVAGWKLHKHTCKKNEK
jgi:MYND finger